MFSWISIIKNEQGEKIYFWNELLTVSVTFINFSIVFFVFHLNEYYKHSYTTDIRRNIQNNPAE